MDGGIVPVWHVCGASPWYHINADALLRIPNPLAYCPNYRAGTRLTRLPCYSQLNPCKFCTRAESTWTHFEDDVNYVVPLTVRKIEVKESDRDSASDHRNSLGDQEVHEQLCQFRQMLEGLEPRLDHRQQDSSQLRPPVAAPPGFVALPLVASLPSPVVRAPVLPPAPPLESSVQPLAPFTMGEAREQRTAAASGPAATVTWSAPAVSTVAPVEPLVSTSVVLPFGTANVGLPGQPQVPLVRGFLPASRMASAAIQAPGRISVPRVPVPPRTSSPGLPGNPGEWQQVPYRTRAPAQSTQPWRIEASSVHEHQLTHVPATSVEQRAESVSASTAPPSVAEAKKTKRRKPSQLARKSRLRKSYNCGKRGFHSVECTRPCYKCDFLGHHSVWCPYSVNRALDRGASSSSHSSVQSTPEQPVRPASMADPPSVAMQPPLWGALPPATTAPRPSLGGAYLPWVPFCPCHQWEEGLSCWLPWTGTVARLWLGLHSPRHPFQPASRVPGLQRQLPLFPHPRLRHSLDWVQPRLGDSSSAPPVPPQSPPQRPQLFQVQVRQIHLYFTNEIDTYELKVYNNVQFIITIEIVQLKIWPLCVPNYFIYFENFAPFSKSSK